MRKVGAVRRISAFAAAAGLLFVGAPMAAASSSTIGTQEWWLYGSLNYSGAWTSSLGDGVTVAVIGDVADTSVSDLSGSLVGAETFPPSLPVTDPDIANQDCESTEAASLIAGHGHSVSGGTDGVVGLAAHAKVMPLGISVQGTQLTSSTYFAEAVQSAVSAGAKVIDVVVPTANDSTVSGAIQSAIQAGVVVVAPTGDTGTTGNVVWTPAVYPGVIAVAASQQNGSAWTGSAHGSQVTVAAPGANMVATGPGGNYVHHTGTNCAAALVAGEAALLFKAHPSWTAGQIERVIINTASGNGTRVGDSLGFGVVNPTAAVAAAAPASTTNPLLPQPAQPTASASPTGASAQGAAAGKSSGGSSSSIVLIVVIAVVALGLVAGLVLWLKKRSKGKRYALPEMAPVIDRGPSDYPAYQQQQPFGQPEQQPFGQPGQQPFGQPPPQQPQQQPFGQPDQSGGYGAYQAPGYPAPGNGGLDQSGYSIGAYTDPQSAYPGGQQPGQAPEATQPDADYGNGYPPPPQYPQQ